MVIALLGGFFQIPQNGFLPSMARLIAELQFPPEFGFTVFFVFAGLR